MKRQGTRPAVHAPHRWVFPNPDRAHLDNGLSVLAFHRPGQYVASVGLVIDTPLSMEPSGIEGVAALTHSCLDEGTATHPGTSFTEALEDLGAELGGTVTHPATEVFVEATVPRLAEALALMAEAVVEPTLTADDVLRHKALRLAQIDQLMVNSAQRAAIEFRRACIPGRFRASRMAGGTRDTVEAITPAHVADFHSQYYRPDGATLVLAGDFEDDPFELVARAFSSWQGEPARGIVHQVPRARRPHCRVIHRPGAVQADVRLGGFGIDRGDPRWPAVQVACHAVGGAFLSRLNRVLREEKGYSYGVHLVDHPMRDGGLIAVQGSFRTEVVADAITWAVRLLDVVSDPITDAEVKEAVGFLQGTSPMRYSTARGVTGRVAGLLANGLSADFVNSFASALDRVTASEANAALTDLLPPDRLTLVVVGDATVIGPQLTDAGWDVELR